MTTKESFLEATIEDVQARMKAGSLSCETLVQWYLARIARHDRQGPALQAIVNINPKALDYARELDRHLRETGSFKGPLHGVPVLVKDGVETADMPTTFGNETYANYQPTSNGTLVRRLMEAGAVVLAKTSMCDFAAGWFSFSSVTERTRNPYATERDAGGSSAGTGAGVAANFGLVGVGEDTGGSIRIPSSFNNLFGLRPTTGLISRNGFQPLLHFQDTPGPMARSVRDLAKLLDVLAGYDPADPFTCAATMSPELGRYEALLGGGKLEGMRVGVLKDAFGDDEAVNQVVRASLEKLKQAGVQLVEVSIANLGDWISRTSVYLQGSKADMNRFMAGRPGFPAQTFEEIYEKRRFHPLNDLFHGMAEGPSQPQPDVYYAQRVAQGDFQRLILNLLAGNALDFLMYPDVQVLPPTYTDLEGERWSCLTFPTNTVIASQSHLPGLSMPAGFAPGGIPVGVEVVGKPFSEAALLQFAFAYEKMAQPRKPPRLEGD